MIFTRKANRAIYGELVLKEARKIVASRVEDASRRSFLTRTLTLGGLTMLSGCTLDDNENVEKALMAVSRWSDRVQGQSSNPRPWRRLMPNP